MFACTFPNVFLPFGTLATFCLTVHTVFYSLPLYHIFLKVVFASLLSPRCRAMLAATVLQCVGCKMSAFICLLFVDEDQDL